MTVTVLPGLDESSSAPPEPPRRSLPTPSRPVVLLVVLAVTLAGFGGWKLLGSGGADEPVGAPVAQPKAPAPKKDVAPVIPAHGKVSTKQLQAVAVPVFAAMNESLGGWTVSGQPHRPNQHNGDAVDRRFRECFGGQESGAGDMTSLQSGKYTSGNHEVRGQLSVTPGPAAAMRDFRQTMSAQVVGCLREALPKGLRHEDVGQYLSATRLTMHRLSGVPHAFRMRLLAGFIVSGHELPIEVDVLGAVVGRAEVSLTVSSHDTRLATSRENAALRAMVKQVRTSLR
jgi:hypothetical protein